MDADVRKAIDDRDKLIDEFRDFAKESKADRRRLNLRVRKALHRITVVLAVLFALQIAVGVAYLVLNADQGKTADQAKDTAGQAKHLAQEIQASRVEQITIGCRAQNTRNHATLILLRNLPPSPPRPGVPKRGTPAYDRLLRRFVDALAGPVRDCRVVARRIAAAGKG